MTINLLQKELRTERLHLIPLSRQHLPFQAELDTDPDTMHFIGGPRTPEVCETELDAFLVEATRGLGYWAGFVDAEFVGYWILRVPELPVSSVSCEDLAHEVVGELGYRLLPRFWRRGLASEGARTLLRHGFEELGLQKIVAFTAARNLASRATMVSVGMDFLREFEVDPAGWPEGTDLHGVEYAVRLEDWCWR